MSNGLQIWHGLDQNGIGSNEGGDHFGFSLATGDFNGDGKDDLAVGAPSEYPGNDPCSGSVFIYKGTGLKLQPWQGLHQEIDGLELNEDHELFGWTLATGDFNNDGKDDLAVGTPRELAEDINNVRAGAVFLYKGNTNRLSGWQMLSQKGIGSRESSDWFGASLATGDINNDNKDDLIVGSPGEDPATSPESGYVFLYTGGYFGLDYLNGLDQKSIDINEQGDWFGGAVCIGHYEGGNTVGLVVGAPGEKGLTSERGAINYFQMFPRDQNKDKIFTRFSPVVRLQNRWKNDQYIHIEHGSLECSTILMGWHSAQWMIEL